MEHKRCGIDVLKECDEIEATRTIVQKDSHCAIMIKMKNLLIGIDPEDQLIRSKLVSAHDY